MFIILAAICVALFVPAVGWCKSLMKPIQNSLDHRSPRN